MISPISALRGARSNVGTGAGRAGDKVKRSSRLRDLVDLDARKGRERERNVHNGIDVHNDGSLTLLSFLR
jgi:hypothetical protein